MNIFRDAVTDADGVVDVSYLAMYWVMIFVLSAIVFVCAMSAIAYLRCVPSDKVTCSFDAQGVGLAVGAICGGFATAIGGLAAYMAATTRDRNRSANREGQPT